MNDKADYFALGGRAAGVYARVAQVQRIVRLVTEGTSVEVVGTRWSGRTELLRRVHQALASVGLTIITVRGVGSGLPLEAIRTALPVGPSNTRADSLSASGLIHRLSQTLTEGPAVVLLDDGDLLDEASWTVLESAHKRTGTPIVGVTLQRAMVSPADHLLIKIAHPVVKIALEELKMETLHELLEDRLGGPVAPSLSGRIHTKSGGIPGFALAIADSARAHGQLRKSGEVWRDEPDLWSADLNAAYESLLYTHPNDAREALELLSLVGPVAMTQGAQLVGQEMLEILEGHGLARLFVTGERALIAVNPPGLGDYFRNRPLTVQRMRLFVLVEETLGKDVKPPLTPAPEHRMLTPAVSPQELPLVARMFSEQYRTEVALTWNEWEQNQDAAAAVRVLRIQLTGEGEESRLLDVVQRTTLTDVDPMLEVEFRFLRARLLTVTERAFTDIEEALRPAPRFVHAAALAALLEGMRMERFGIPENYENVFASAVQAEGVDGEIGRVVLAAIRSLSGEGVAALDLLDGITDGFAIGLADMARGLALFASGQFAEAVEWSTAQVQVAISETDRAALVSHSYIAALSLLSMGRYDEAAEVGHIVTSAGLNAARLLFAPDKALLLALALAATRTGRTLTAQGMLERAERYRGRSDALPAGAVATLEATTIAADGELHAAARSYHGIAVDLRKQGFSLAADGAELMAILSEYDAKAAADLRPRAEHIGGRLFTTYLDAREAIHREDPDALRAAARALRAEHATDEALKHLTFAATLYRDRGMVDDAADVRGEIRELMASDVPVTASAATRAESSWGLTSREKEIIDDIAGGRSNVEIAQRHGISVRTIETHIRNIRRKTGALNREEMSSFAQRSAR